MKYGITLLTNNVCNKKCKYCYEHNTGDKVMTIDQIDYILKRLWNLPGLDRHILFFGGEPTISLNVIRDCMEKYPMLTYSIITNGYFLMNYDYEEYEFLKNMIGINISVEGTSKAFLELRGEDNLYEYLEKIKMLKDKGWKNIVANISINGILRDNIDEFIKVCNFLRYNNIGLHLYSINGEDNFKNSEEYAEFLICVGKKAGWLLDLIVGKGMEDADTDYLCALEWSFTFDGDLNWVSCARDQNNPTKLTEISDDDLLKEWSTRVVKTHISNYPTCEECEVPVGNCTRSCPAYIKEKLDNKEYNILDTACEKEIIKHRIRKGLINIEEEKVDINEKLKNIDSLELILSGMCNLDCKYCFEKNKIKETMSPETAIKLIDSTIEKAKNNFVNITLFGGEPIMPSTYETRLAILEKIKSSNKNYGITIITNLFELEDRDFKWFKELKQCCKNLYVQVSIDSIKEINDKYRVTVDNKGTFNKVTENIKKLSSIIKSESIGINSVIASIESIENIPNWIKYLSNEMLHYFYNIMYSTNQSRSGKVTDNEYTVFKKAYQKVYDMYCNGEVDLKVVKPLLKYHKREILENTEGCTSLKNCITVDPSGWVLPCHFDLGNTDYKVLNMLTGEYGERISDAYNIFTSMDNYICSICDINRDCKRCKVAGYYMNGGIPSYTCDIHKKLYQIKEEVCDINFRVFDENELKEFTDDIKFLEKEVNNGNKKAEEALCQMAEVFFRRKER